MSQGELKGPSVTQECPLPHSGWHTAPFESGVGDHCQPGGGLQPLRECPPVPHRFKPGQTEAGGAVRPPPPRRQPFPDPRGMPGLLQPPGPVDPMQRLALMMAVMVLGMPQVHSCHTSTIPEMSWSGDMSEPRICLPVVTGSEKGISAVGERLDPSHWEKLPAMHCQATQSVLSFVCGIDGRTKAVKYEKFRQPCVIQPAACWEALKSGKLNVGELEHSVAMNRTRSHMAGMEDCSGNCGS
jgi:hypothetical protein